MKTIIYSALLYAFALFLTYTSITPHNSTLLLISVLFLLIIMGLVLSLTLSVWFEGTFSERMRLARRTGFPLAPVVYILGYLFIIVESLIRG
jgi:hypothetical protein